MAASLNQVQLIGRFGKDPEVRVTQGGSKVASMSVATAESWTIKTTGQKEEKTEWHKVIAFGKLAEIIEKYVQKGMLIYVTGKLQTRKWTDKENVERYSTEIMADQMKMLESRKDNPVQRDEPEYQPETGTPKKISDDAPFDDDIPF